MLVDNDYMLNVQEAVLMDTFIAMVIGCGIVGIGLYAIFESSLMIVERRKQYREGTHDYYGNKIDEEQDK